MIKSIYHSTNKTITSSSSRLSTLLSPSSILPSLPSLTLPSPSLTLPSTLHNFHTLSFNFKDKKLFLLKEERMTPLDKTLLKDHVKNYKKIQKQQLKTQEFEIQKSEKSNQLNKQLSRLGINKSQLKLGHLTNEDYEYLMKHRKEISGAEEFKSKKTATTVSSLLVKKFNKNGNERKQYRFSIIVKRTLDNILFDPSINKDYRIRNGIKITNVSISKDFRTITIKWMKSIGFLNANDQSSIINDKDDLFFNNNIIGNYTNMDMMDDDLNINGSNHNNYSNQLKNNNYSNHSNQLKNNGPEIYEIEKLNSLLQQASGFISSHLTQTLGLKYAPQLIFSPIITNVQELENAPLSIQEKYQSILELKRTFEILNGGECDPMVLVTEQLECDEFLADKPLKKPKIKYMTIKDKNGKETMIEKPKFMRRRRPLNPFTF